MKAFFGLLLALVLSIPGGDALAQITDLNSAINKAGRQRMLSQRMAKAYFQIGQQVEVERSKKILDTSVSLFDRQLVELKNFAPTPEIKENYLKLERTWLAYKDLLVGEAPSGITGARFWRSPSRCWRSRIRGRSSSRSSRLQLPVVWSISQVVSACSRSAWPSSTRRLPGG